MLGFDLNILFAVPELDIDGCIVEDVPIGDLGSAKGIGKLANGLKRGWSSDWVLVNENIFPGLPEAG